MMDVSSAVRHAEAILQRHARMETGKPVECVITLWAVESVRVAEVDWHIGLSGSSYMQSDLPYGLAVCASVERWIIALVHGDMDLIRDERANASYLVVGTDRP